MHEYNLHTSWLYGGGRHQLARPYKRLYGPNRCRRTRARTSAIGVVPFYARARALAFRLACLPSLPSSLPPSLFLSSARSLSQNALLMARVYIIYGRTPANPSPARVRIAALTLAPAILFRRIGGAFCRQKPATEGRKKAEETKKTCHPRSVAVLTFPSGS